jgi:hypothetical protein
MIDRTSLRRGPLGRLRVALRAVPNWSGRPTMSWARGSGRALLRALGVASGGFVGAVVGAGVALILSCEPDYPMLCELAAPFAGFLGLPIGATLASFIVGMALRRTLLKQLSFVAACVILGVGVFLLVLGTSYPRAFQNLFFLNAHYVRFVAVVSAFLGVTVGGIALLLEVRRQRRQREE